MSVSSVTGVNSTPSADSVERGRAVAYFQPLGIWRCVAKLIAFAAGPLGYSSTVFQLITARFALDDAAKLNPWGSDGRRKSSDTSTALAPSGTVTSSA